MTLKHTLPDRYGIRIFGDRPCFSSSGLNRASRLARKPPPLNGYNVTLNMRELVLKLLALTSRTNDTWEDTTLIALAHH
jgi:hypothetical protein